MPNFLHLPLMSGVTETFQYSLGLSHQEKELVPEYALSLSNVFAKILKIADTTNEPWQSIEPVNQPG